MTFWNRRSIEYLDHTVTARRMRSGYYRGIVTTPGFVVKETANDFSKPDYAIDAGMRLVDSLLALGTPPSQSLTAPDTERG